MRKEIRQQIREAYKAWTPRSDPYQYFDWLQVFTPIEKNVWSDIRFLGLPFYPQFPVERYFVDFADPVKKIAIEVDGKEWHGDYEKDKLRQIEIEKLGWTIVRILGQDTFKHEEGDEESDDCGVSESEKILQELKNNEYTPPDEPESL